MKFYPLIMLCCITALQADITVMLDPAGHAKQTGRQLEQSFERSETLKWATCLKNELERLGLSVALTRSPGEELVPLQAASFANRTNTKLFIRLQLYRHESPKPCLNLYRLEYDPMLESANQSATMAFTPVYQAHLPARSSTIALCQQLSQGLQAPHYASSFTFEGCLALPLKNHVGIQAPALTLEAGINQDTQWDVFVPALAQQIKLICWQ
jgi:hypothetical protein